MIFDIGKECRHTIHTKAEAAQHMTCTADNQVSQRADGVAMEQHGEEVGWAAVEPLAKLLWEGKGTGGVGGGDEISIGWAKAVAACANSRVLTSVAPEDER